MKVVWCWLIRNTTKTDPGDVEFKLSSLRGEARGAHQTCGSSSFLESQNHDGEKKEESEATDSEIR